MLQRLREIDTYDPAPVEVLGGMTATALGCWLLNPLWRTFTSAAGYRVLAKVLSEPQWGVLFLLIGLLQLSAVLSQRSIAFRCVAAFILSVVWAFIAWTFFESNPASLGIPVYAVLALTEAWAFKRLVDRGGG